MSDYTVELRKLPRDWVVSKGLTRYPIFDEAHRPHLNGLILDNYAYREIAHETPEMFVHRLDVTMRTEMPYFNDLYLTLGLDYDFLVNVDMVSHTESENVGDSTSDSENTTTAKSQTQSDNKQLDFPQSHISDENDYLTSQGLGISVQDSTGEGATKNVNHDEGTTDTDSTSKGISGVSRATLLTEYRSAILNVDQMVVRVLEPLFMQLWNPGKSRTF